MSEAAVSSQESVKQIICNPGPSIPVGWPLMSANTTASFPSTGPLWSPSPHLDGVSDPCAYTCQSLPQTSPWSRKGPGASFLRLSLGVVWSAPLKSGSGALASNGEPGPSSGESQEDPALGRRFQTEAT